MYMINAYLYQLQTAFRLVMMVGIKQLSLAWDRRTLAECQEGHASALEAAAYLTVQNMPRLRQRRGIDRKLRQLIQNGYIRKGVLANGYPDPNLLVPEDDQQQSELPFEELPEPAEPETLDVLISNIDHQETATADLEILDGLGEEDGDDTPLPASGGFYKGVLIGAGAALVIPAAIWLKPQYLNMTGQNTERYSPQVIKVAASRGQDCARSDDLYSQLFCGELWRKELSARVEQTYIDLLAVSAAVDQMQGETGFSVSEPLATRVRNTHHLWEKHAEARCNTAAAVESLGVKRSNLYLDCIHKELLAREKEARGQLNYLRSLGWHEQADDALNNELIAIRNMAASQPKPKTADEDAQGKGEEPAASQTAPTD